MDKLESLLAYIEQSADDLGSNARRMFLEVENIWMRGYLMALEDYKVKSVDDIKEARSRLIEIVR